MGVLVWIFDVVTKGFQILRRRCWIFILLDLDVKVKIQILIPCYISPRIQTCIRRTSIMRQFLRYYVILIKCRLASFIVHHLHELLFLRLFKVLLQELFFSFLSTCLLDYDWALFCISAEVIGLWHLIQNWVQYMTRILSFSSFLRHCCMRRILILKVQWVDDLSSQLRFLNIQYLHLHRCFHLIVIQRLALSRRFQPASALFPFCVQIVANLINFISVLFGGNFMMLFEI